MAWIESHQALRDHPKTKRLARALGVARVTAVGYLHFLWWWCVDYAPDGDLNRFSDADIADGCEWADAPDAFVSALGAAGFLDADRRVHDWGDYTGLLVTKREADAERKRMARARLADVRRTSNGRLPDGDRTADVPNHTNQTLYTNQTNPRAPAREGGAVAPEKEGQKIDGNAGGRAPTRHRATRAAARPAESVAAINASWSPANLRRLSGPALDTPDPPEP